MKRTVMVLMALMCSAAFAAVAGAEGAAGNEAYRDPAQLSRLIETGKPAYILVDVRTPAEFATGHIPTAVNIPVTDIAGNPPTKDKNALIVVYCRSGARSAKSKTILEGLGYTGVVDFGGISRWTGSLNGKNE
jgi:phage shock protein E